LGKPTLKQILEALKTQVLVGKFYLGLAQGLVRADPVILQTAPIFFGLTTNGSLELAQMAVARLYDKTSGAVTVQAMLAQAILDIGSFQQGTEQQVSEAIAGSKKVVLRLEPVLDAIRRRRNEWFAHLDPRSVADPKALAAEARLTIPDLERALKETEEMLVKLTCLYDGTFGELRFIGGDDYETALNWIRVAKCAWVENYEKKFGVGSWTGPRPKDCSRAEFDLL
jgi:AbiU2